MPEIGDPFVDLKSGYVKRDDRRHIPELIKRSLSDAFKELANKSAAAAQQNAPIGKRHKHGQIRYREAFRVAQDDPKVLTILPAIFTGRAAEIVFLPAYVMNIAPQAAALEVGSGIHGKRGRTYVIAAKNARNLRIPVDTIKPPYGKTVQWLISTGQPYLLVSKVEHPGVRGREYVLNGIVDTLLHGGMDVFPTQFRDRAKKMGLKIEEAGARVTPFPKSE